MNIKKIAMAMFLLATCSVTFCFESKELFNTKVLKESFFDVFKFTSKRIKNTNLEIWDGVGQSHLNVRIVFLLKNNEFQFCKVSSIGDGKIAPIIFPLVVGLIENNFPEKYIRKLNFDIGESCIKGNSFLLFSFKNNLYLYFSKKSIEKDIIYYDRFFIKFNKKDYKSYLGSLKKENYDKKYILYKNASKNHNDIMVDDIKNNFKLLQENEK